MVQFDKEPNKIIPCFYEDGVILQGKQMRIDINKDFNEISFMLEDIVHSFKYDRIEYNNYYYTFNIIESIGGFNKINIYGTRNSMFYLDINTTQKAIYLENTLMHRLIAYLLNRYE